jgi:fructan beta-fructosidase
VTKFNDKFRPQFHFTPEANWMNDPNGLVYYEGEYHLFYQYHPDGTTWGPMHWGHAVSGDLVHWEHLPIALKPDDNGFVFSGSAVVDWQDSSGLFSGGSGLVAIFTHHDTDPETRQARQRQSIAYSVDKGRTWIKYAGNPVLMEENLPDFRDPKVFWHEVTERWVMVLATGDHIRFYVSSDLKTWFFSGAFGMNEGSHDGVWECPDLFELSIEGEIDRKKWVLVVSIGDNPRCPEGSRTQYFVGDFDGNTFVNANSPDTIIWLDHGRDNYAGVSWSDIPKNDGRRILLGWMSNWKYANYTPTVHWRSAMTIPRVLSLRKDVEGIRLTQRPIKELQHIRSGELRFQDIKLNPSQPFLPGISGDLLELRVEFELGEAEEIGLKLRASDHQETIVGFNVQTSNLYIDRSASGLVEFHSQFACKHSAALQPVNGRILLHVFVDWSSVEVFANDGKLVMTDLIFPDTDSKGLELFASGGTAKILSLEIYTLNSIYTDSRLTAVHDSI